LTSIYHKTRIAPTPSGYLHLGNVLSFAITAALADRRGAEILLRIDDIDRQRAGVPFINDIFDTLNFLNIPWQQGPRNAVEFEEQYSQIHRLTLYQNALNQLCEGGHVFACNCSRSSQQSIGCKCLKLNVPLDTPGVSWRFINPPDSMVQVKGLAGNYCKLQLPEEMQHFVVKKKDGFPSYQLTSVIDDDYYKVDLVVRGNDLLPSTLAQLQLAAALGLNKLEETTFYHHPLILDAAGHKLSKSAGATSINYLRSNGKEATDIFAIIGTLIGVDQSVSDWRRLGDILLRRVDSIH